VESLFGAIYVETGFATVRELILEHLSDRVDERAVDPGRRDYKTRLQERLARRGIQPEYVTTDSGPEHQKEFVAQVFADGQLLGVGRGTSKKRAEQDAARNATKHSFSNDA
jgi:ribonuclease-3